MDIQFAREKLQSILFVRRFPRDDDVRKKQFQFEEQLRDTFPGPAKVLNLPPNAPPDAPRFFLVEGPRTLTVTAIATQLTLDFTDGVPSKLNIFDTINKYASRLDRAYEAIFAEQSQAYAGIVITIQRSYAGADVDVARYICENFLKMDPSTVNTAAATFGGGDADFFRTVEVSQYQQLTEFAQLTPGVATPIFIDFDFGLQTPERGLQIRIDVNTKPKKEDAGAAKFARVVPILLSMFAAPEISKMGPLLIGHVP